MQISQHKSGFWSRSAPPHRRGRNRVPAGIVRHIFCLLFGWLFLAGTETRAQTDWSNLAGGNFATGSNWAGGIAPAPNQTARFALSGGGTIGVTFTSPTNTASLIVDRDAFVFNLGGNTYALTSPNSGFQMGVPELGVATGFLTLYDGTITTNDGLIGAFAGTNSTLTLGAGSRFVANGELIAGNAGTGTISVLNGGTLDANQLTLGATSTGTGILTIEGPTAVANVSGGVFGNTGSGNVNIRQGGTLNTTTGVFLASNSGSSSTVTINGENSSWNLNGAFLQTGNGTSAINVTDGQLNAHNSSILLAGNSSMSVFGGRVNFTGDQGSGLQLNNGSVLLISNGNVSVAQSAGLRVGTGSTVTMTGGELSTTNMYLDGTLDYRGGRLAINGGLLDGNGSLALSGTNGNSTFTLANGATTVGVTSLAVGSANNGQLRQFDVLSGSTLNTSALGTIGQQGSNSLVRVSGQGSIWNANNIVSVGDGGAGSLVVENGGRLNTNGNSLLTGVAGAVSNGTVTVQAGGRVDAGNIELARIAGSVSSATITGNGTTVNASGLFVGGSSAGEGGTANLTISDGAQVNIAGTLRARNAGTITLDGGDVTTQSFTRNATGVLNFRNGTLTVLNSWSNNGGDLTIAGFGVNDNPHLVLAGSASTIGIANTTVGNSSRAGTMTIQDNAQLTTGALTIGSMGEINLDGGRLVINSFANSGAFHWNQGTVNFQSGTALNGTTLTSLLGSGHVLGQGRTLGSLGGTMTLDGSLNVNDGGTLNPANLTNNSTLSVNGGQVVTGTLINNAGRSILVSGNSGLIANTALQNSGSLRLNSPAASVSGGQFNNLAGGTVSGTGQINNDLFNSGVIRSTGSEHLVFTSRDNQNLSNINLAGGTIEFTESLFNRSGAAITGRGTLITSSTAPGGLGLVNDGVMSFSAGITDVYGDVDNGSDGRIVTSGAGITTFFDDVTHNGQEIRTFLGSTTVFLGEQTGAGNFTGPGTVEYAGDLRPGNSPASISYEGDVFMNSSVRSFFELGGQVAGEFDQLLIDGDFNVDGDLFVSLINGYSLGAGDSFLIGDVGGSLFGEFNGLSEGALVGNFGGRELFITYAGGNGNDIALFTAIPEPATGVLLLGMIGGCLLRRRKRPCR